MFNPLEKLEELKTKTDKIIICNCDAFSGILIHKQLIDLFGKGCFKTIHSLMVTHPEASCEDLAVNAMHLPEFIITTCWDERSTKILFEGYNIRIYSFSNLLQNGSF